ncbi:DedA family protein [Auraticoccus sp. F435]|uniref:DedA family protein n=1 Tax=Auraticoccus cholistanensis TaxID=2656650 RepID=A0A6A9V1Z1_9ACTN|nr:DedA family protein [Auraticoccus cholistanensis]MVA77584.1 DedA family protein [Auraticoccus cholistanensis]
MSIFERVVEWVVHLMDLIGAPGVGVAILLENVFPPIPSELVLPLAGYTAQLGRFGVVEALVWATAGSVTGAWLLYGLGAAFGAERLARIAERVPLTEAGDVHRAVAWFDRHGGKAIFMGRLVPGVRSLISIPAGIDRMNPVTFTVYTLLGSALWNTLLIGAGYLLGTQWGVVESYIGVISKVVYVLLVLGVVFVVWRLVRRHRRAATHAAGLPQDEHD